MKRKIIFIILILISKNTYCEWVYMASTSTGALYLDNSRISKDNGVVRVWALVDYKKELITGTKKQETLKEFDCKNKTTKDLQMKTYDSNNTHTDTINYRFNWHGKIGSGNLDDFIYQKVCY